ncbi:hypothetical protein B0J14DRAFT_604047 [Halenospora varia]|nr:hypothetical protein B0J14DRAFT_604047 [Halenospora varia]
MKFTLPTMTAFLATTILALPSPAPEITTQLVSDFNIPAPTSEQLAAFAAIPKEPSTPAGATLSSTQNKERSVIEARDEVYLTITADANWQGRRETLTAQRGQCFNLGNGWPDTISSVGPNTGTTCCLFDNYNCRNGGGFELCGITFPGIANLHAINWGDRANSFKCD